MSNKINQEHVIRLEHEFEDCLAIFDQAGIFTGPSVYFHRKTLAERARLQNLQEVLRDGLYFDYLYATLASWGMHRMGKGNTRLCEMEHMRKSIERQIPNILTLQNLHLEAVQVDRLERTAQLIWEIIQNLEIGIGGVKIVAGSKALHHILPELVPPIDREYTLRFFYGNKNINRPEYELFYEIYRQYHHLAVSQRGVIATAIRRGGNMNTSTTKVIDNAIVGFVLKHIKNQPPLERAFPHPVQPAPDAAVRPAKGETHAMQILRAAGALVTAGNLTFTRDDVRRYRNISPEEWLNGYTAIFQGMRADHPGGAPKVADRYQGVFRQVSRGVYELTDKGRKVLG